MFRPVAALLLGCLPLAAPAETLTHTWTPRTIEEADALRLGLALYSLNREVRSGGTIRQWGRDNAAALLQSGGGNWGAIIQGGEGHHAALRQTGGGNAHAIIQAGRGAEAAVEQTGGEVGVTVQVGW
jgi:hypothetical protein